MTGTDYIASLGDLDRVDYIHRLVLSNSEKLPNPYAIPDHEWVLDMSKWPSIMLPDIHTYLIEKPRVYTKKNLHAYMSLDAYNYVLCGHVHEIKGWKKGCDPFRILNILQPSFLRFVQFTAQQLPVISPALLKMQWRSLLLASWLFVHLCDDVAQKPVYSTWILYCMIFYMFKQWHQ